MHNKTLEKVINEKLRSNSLEDYAPNGLQVEGREEIHRIVTGVTACQALLESAITYCADAVIVHHGFFWKNESQIISGMKRQRLKMLLANDINLYAWHIPLDIHMEIGNNAQLAKDLNIKVKKKLNSPFVFFGTLEQPISGNNLRVLLEKRLGRHVLHSWNNKSPKKISEVAWCTGAGQNLIELAVLAGGIDAFITGEVSEKTIHVAREECLHFYAAGHHATERGGVRALGNWLRDEHGLDTNFIDIPNPA
ncbi:dinuclear metal center protein, YbgI/SA1388 family [secondary endosymbiont of Heteropsylla cubana]|uniref:GTP cyclohydrolase 1 type 2 homolog n=1 Tax=secondary endosymbiont of Heteropsylla cubana TaxID=134287 RepID=J3Z5Q2_9ENTR|nr:Nif3-like dinuclear metal center hexameric protein [secondary endosymbiont of Heteropsylla cubana]AFP85674.1 dinuclear metal center protein, YbgI/SA1388 family [secondary endosymbiont of Heteropsylla cubana]